MLTAQTSGVLPAQACARYLECPMIFAREKRPITMAGGVYEAKSKSHTRGSDVSLFVDSNYITKNDAVLVVDDFLARSVVMPRTFIRHLGRSFGPECTCLNFVHTNPSHSGTTAVALLEIVRQAGASCVGFAFLIEKSFEGACGIRLCI